MFKFPPFSNKCRRLFWKNWREVENLRAHIFFLCGRCYWCFWHNILNCLQKLFETQFFNKALKSPSSFYSKCSSLHRKFVRRVENLQAHRDREMTHLDPNETSPWGQCERRLRGKFKPRFHSRLYMHVTWLHFVGQERPRRPKRKSFGRFLLKPTTWSKRFQST